MHKITITRTIGVIGLALGASLPAYASISCETVLKDYNNAVENNATAQACYLVEGTDGEAFQVCDNAAEDVTVASSLVQNYPECFGGLNHGIAIENIRSTVFQQMYTMSNSYRDRLRSALRPANDPDLVDNSLEQASENRQQGVAGGNMPKRFNAWGGVSKTRSEYDRGVFAITQNMAATNQFDADIHNFILGADYQLRPNMVAGASAAFDKGTGKAESNRQGVAGSKSSQDLDFNGYAIAPYIGWQINDQWALDAQIGFGKGTSTVGNLNETDITRFFYGANLDYTRWLNNWQLSGKASYLFGQEKADDVEVNGITAVNTDAKNTLDQFRLGGQVGYWMDNGVMPFARVAYLTENHTSSATIDEQAATSIGKNAFIWSLGVNIFRSSNLYGGLSYLHESGRNRADIQQLMANISYRF